MKLLVKDLLNVSLHIKIGRGGGEGGGGGGGVHWQGQERVHKMSLSVFSAFKNIMLTIIVGEGVCKL